MVPGAEGFVWSNSGSEEADQEEDVSSWTIHNNTTTSEVVGTKEVEGTGEGNNNDRNVTFKPMLDATDYWYINSQQQQQQQQQQRQQHLNLQPLAESFNLLLQQHPMEMEYSSSSCSPSHASTFTLAFPSQQQQQQQQQLQEQPPCYSSLLGIINNTSNDVPFENAFDFLNQQSSSEAGSVFFPQFHHQNHTSGLMMGFGGPELQPPHLISLHDLGFPAAVAGGISPVGFENFDASSLGNHSNCRDDDALFLNDRTTATAINKVLRPLEMLPPLNSQPTLFQKRALSRLGSDKLTNLETPALSSGEIFSGWRKKSEHHQECDLIEEGASFDLSGGFVYDSDEKVEESVENNKGCNSNTNSSVPGVGGKGGDEKGKRKGMPAKNLMAERRRRQKLNDRLIMLRSVVPKISKV